MSTVTSNLQYLLSLDSAQWQFMLDSHIIHLVFVAATDSLTLTRNLIITIRDTRNKKHRRKYITEFTLLFTEVRLGAYGFDDLTDNALSDLVFIHKAHYNHTEPDVVVVAHIRSNETGHGVASAYQVGDSKHYKSCLRSGVQRSGIDITNKDFNTKSSYVHTEVTKHVGSEHSEYIEDEIHAFASGDIQYCAVGSLYTEGGEGYLGRYRIHKGKTNTNKEVYVLSGYYGIEHYRKPILDKILEHYGVGNVFVLDDGKYITDKVKVGVHLNNVDTYNAEVDEYSNYAILSSEYPKPDVKRTSRFGSKVYAVNYMSRLYHFNRRVKPITKNPHPLVVDNLPTDRCCLWLTNTHNVVMKSYLSLITGITGCPYYMERNIIGSYSVHTDAIGYDRHTISVMPFSISFKISDDLWCSLSWAHGLVLIGSGVQIMGHKNIRKLVKIGLLNTLNKRLKTKYEALPGMPTMQPT